MGGKGVWRWGEREIIYLSLHCHHQNDFCIKMGSDESHFNVSVGRDGQSHKTVSTNYNLSEEKGEPKRYRTEVLPLTSLTPYRYTKPAHNMMLRHSWVGSVGYCPQMSVDILGTSRDQCRSMVQYCFTSTETRRLVRTDSPGRPPRLSHSS